MAASSSVPVGQAAAERYWQLAGRSSRLVLVSIGNAGTDIARARALTVRAARIGLPLDQEVWGRQTPLAACRSRVLQLGSDDSVFAVLLLPATPDHVDLADLRAMLQPYKDLMRPGAWHCAGPVRPGEVDFLIDSAVSAHQTHGQVVSGGALQNAR